MKTKILTLGVGLFFLIVSCSKDDTNDNTTITAEEANINAKIDVANDDVSDIVEGQFSATSKNSISGKSSEDTALTTNLSTCVTISRNPAFGTSITPGTVVTKTLTFGTSDSGCVMANGNILKGTIIISFTFNPAATSHIINYEFVNFYHNSIKFDGKKTFTRTMSLDSANTPSHPIVVMNMNMMATFPDGQVFTRVGTRTREIIAGYATPAIFADNIYQVTGNWTTTFPNTSVQTSTITSPLLVKMSCIAVNKPLLVQGVITFARTDKTATLNYGDGECDNLAVFTINGDSYNIVIGN